MDIEKFGELFFLGFPDGIDAESIRIIEKIKPAGVILYPRNMKDVRELQITMERLYELIDRNIPLLISSDHEGGQLETVPAILPSPGNYAIGKTKKSEYAFEFGNYLGKKLKELGFNMVFAPVLDVFHENSSAVTGFRAFSSSPYEVAVFGNDFIKGLKNNGILPTAKHFPGHGKATTDSHEELPKVDDFSFYDGDLIPFKSVIEDVELIMSAHIIYTKMDDKIATLSKRILTDLLRKELNYRGLVISDAIEMKALYENYTPKEVIKGFFDAGGDILLIGDAKANMSFYYEFVELARNKELDLEKLSKSVEKVKELKERYVRSDYEGRFLSKIAKEAVEFNLEKDINVDSATFLIPYPRNLSPADTSASDVEKLESLIRSEFKDPKIVKYDMSTGKLESKLQKEKTIISFVLDSFRFPGQLKMQKELKKHADQVVYIITRNDNDKKYYKDELHIVTHSAKLISIYHSLKILKDQTLRGGGILC